VAAEYAQWFLGRHVTIIPDNDAAGREHAQAVAAALQSDAASVKVVALPGLKVKGDVSDWLDAGGTPEQLRDLIEATPFWEPPPADDPAEIPERVTGGDWPEPQDLPGGPPPVAPFPIDLLPEALALWVEDVADRMQVPADFVAIPAMVAAGATIGRNVGIYPKRRDSWLVVPNIWGAVIGRPGIMKTPAAAEAIRPLRAMEARSREAYDAAMKVWASRREVETEVRKLRGAKIREALKGRQDPETLAREIAQDQSEIPEPVRRRFMTNDATIEKLGEILRDNPSGILVFRDEMMGWLRSLEREGREGDRAFYLEAWNGSGRFTYDRIGRGTIDIEAACVSVLGGIQPGPLISYLEGRAWGGAGDDGLLQRFQLAVWPDVPRTWRNVDRYPNIAARQPSSIGSPTSRRRSSGLPPPPAASPPCASTMRRRKPSTLGGRPWRSGCAGTSTPLSRLTCQNTARCCPPWL
jgi:hypothetical protein